MRKLFSLIIAVIATAAVFAQVPQKMSYQAVIRNANNTLVSNQTVGMKISILQGSADGTAVYTETLTPGTNANGLVSIEIGSNPGFANIDWAKNQYFLKTETDPLGGSDYTITGTSQLLSVPYALHANTAQSYDETDPVFAAHPANGITEADINSWNNKFQTLRISNDTIYLTNGGFVKLPVGMPPTATVTETSNVGEFSATLNGIVNAKGLSTVVVFEWGTTTDYGNTIEVPQSPVTGNSDVKVYADLDELISAATYHYRIKAYNAVDVTFSNDLYFTAGFSAPQLTTKEISSITAFSASSGGSIFNDGGSAITASGVCFSQNPNPTVEDDTIGNVSGNNTFTSVINGLLEGTTYYIRAYAINSIGISYGNELNFTTVALAELSTSTFSNLKGTSAKAGGSITNDGGGTVSAHGLCWSTTSGPTISNFVNTAFDDPMTGLSENTVYYVRAYATNEAGTAYGNEISFNSGYVFGSSVGGGLVFYNNGAGHGLVCASVNQSMSASWGCYGTLIGGTLLTINSGEANTNAIVAKCVTAGTAARICFDLNLNTYSDWFLPSIDELNLMYTNLHAQGIGGFASDYYWSSSEDNVGLAWRLHFSAGTRHNDGKDYPVYVRAARAF